MGDITKNFSRWELECSCCGEHKIDLRLVDALQRLRDLVKVPIKVTSGYRCEHHNSAVGGSPKSQHLTGKAADIIIIGMNAETMYSNACQIQRFFNGGIGTYPTKGFIHVDIREEPARWVIE